MLKKVAFTLLLALVLHLTLGWAWTILAGLAGGAWAGRSGLRVGAMGVGLSWALLVGYNFAVAARPVGAMVDALGGIMGGLPGAAVVGLTLLVGLLLGALGGFAGVQLRRLRPAPRPVAV